MVDQQFISDWSERLRSDIPNTVAIILKGSHARNTAEPHSDLDFDVIVDQEPGMTYLAWFEDTGTGKIRHISVAVQKLDDWLENGQEPVSWAYGLPAAETTLLVWARNDALRDKLDQPVRMHPPEEPELEDFIEAWGKINNALVRNDDMAMRLAGQKLGRLCPGLLRVLNPEVLPSNRRQAMHDILAFPVVPDGYREDFMLCLGLSGQAATLHDIREAARRLTFGIFTLLKEHEDIFESLLPADLYGYLRDGTLERYIQQVTDAGSTHD